MTGSNNNKEIINIKKPTKIEKVDKNIAKTTKITKVDIKINETKHSKNNLFNKPKFKKKKSLIWVYTNLIVVYIINCKEKLCG